MDFKKIPDQGALRQILDYDEATGLLFWKERPVSMFHDDCRSAATRAKIWNNRFAGRQAFTAKFSNGYRQGTIHGINYLAHRVIWVWVHGTQPVVIDHLNGIKSDNRIANLRSGSHTENAMNMPKLVSNTSGHTGIHLCKDTKRWRAEIMLHGRSYRLGRFSTLEAAVEARQTAARDLGFNENHGRS